MKINGIIYIILGGFFIGFSYYITSITKNAPLGKFSLFIIAGVVFILIGLGKLAIGLFNMPKKEKEVRPEFVQNTAPVQHPNYVHHQTQHSSQAYHSQVHHQHAGHQVHHNQDTQYARQTNPVNKPSQHIKYCPSCGAALRQFDKFCYKCGNRSFSAR
jgi:hypothetical protein